MTDSKRTDDDRKNQDPDLKNVEHGSDADATPTPDVGKTPPNPNGNEGDTDAKK